MTTRLVIEGNAVYEIDEDCRGCGRKYNSNEQTQLSESEKEEQRKKNSQRPQ